MQLYLVRHGQTDINLENRIQDQLDTHGLNETGQAQARSLADFLKASNLDIESIFSSPLKRAAETAKLLSDTLSIPIALQPGLMEINCGIYEGVKIEDLRAKIFAPPLVYNDVIIARTGAELRDYFAATDPAYNLVSHPGGETKQAARDRFEASLLDICNTNPRSQRICVVAHSKIISLFTDKITSAAASTKIDCGDVLIVNFKPATQLFSYDRRIDNPTGQ